MLGRVFRFFSPESFLSILRDGDKVFNVSQTHEVKVAEFTEAASSKK